MSVATTIDRDTLEQAAREALTRPDHYAAFDDRWYTTHGCVMQWADRADDVLAESNYLVMVDRLNAAIAHDETGASEARGDDVEDSSARHFAYGSVRELFVRVRDDEGAFTPAFIAAVEIRLWLRDHSMLDESDFSDREYAAWEAAMDDAIDSAARDHRATDTAQDEQVIYYLLTTDRESYDLMDCGFPDPDYDLVHKIYGEARDYYFAWLAYCMSPYSPLPGQSPLF